SGANPSAPSATPKHTVTSGPLARAAASGANGSPTASGSGGGASAAAGGSGAGSGGPAGNAGPATAAGGPSAVKTVVSKGQGFTDTTIKIGATFPLSGAIAFVGQECAGGIDAYVKLVNARGGIHGRKIELISYDDAFDPAQTLSNVKRLWEQDKVAMVFAFVVDSANEYVRS